MATQSSPQHNSGLIRQYLAHQETMHYQAVASDTPESVITAPPFGIPNTYSLQDKAEPATTPSPFGIPSMDLLQDRAEPATTPLPFGISNTYSFPTVSPIREQPAPSVPLTKKPQLRLAIAVVLVSILGLGMYFIWHASSSPTTTPVSTTQQQFSVAPTASALKIATTASPVTTNGKIQVYIVGAVKKPGVYTLEGSARIYNLLQAAGGPLPQANLVTLNLASPLSDGQEIYVTRIGETPPASTSSTATTHTTATIGSTVNPQVNINTASADDLRTGLHISSKNAQAIITYRLQHGPFTNVEELLQIVSQTTYKKIENEVKLA